MTIQLTASFGVDNTYYIDKGGIIGRYIYGMQAISKKNNFKMIILSISLFLLGKVRVKWKVIQNENSRVIGNNCRWVYHNKFE